MVPAGKPSQRSRCDPVFSTILSSMVDNTMHIRLGPITGPMMGQVCRHAPGLATDTEQDEAMRLDIMTALFNLVYDGKMHFAPLAGTAGDRILDIGAGTGTWCIDMGDTYPTAEIIGVDISANMPIMVPPNVRFEVDDVEDSWTYSQPFNFIHSRYMAGSIVDWENLMRQCFENLKPGGWAEFQDFDVDYYSQDGTLSTEHALRRWLTTGHGAASTTGRTLKPGARLEEWMRAAGFVNVQAIKTPLPLGPWPKDKRQKRIGLLNWAQLWEGLEGMSLRLFIEVLGYTEAELQLLLVEVRKNLQDPSIHPIFDL